MFSFLTDENRCLKFWTTKEKVGCSKGDEENEATKNCKKILSRFFLCYYYFLFLSLPKEKLTFNLMEKNSADLSELMGKYETLDDQS